VEQKSLIAGLANVGMMLLLLLTGMETDLKLVRKAGRSAAVVTVASVSLPFVLGFAMGQFLPESILPNPEHRLIASMFLGTALSISSIKIVAMVVREMNFMRRDLGQILIASAIMEDTVGWVIIALALGIAGAGAFALASVGKIVIGIALFLVVSYTIGRRLVFWLIRWVNDTFVGEYAVVTAILIVMCAMALVTQAIGVNTVLGAFVAGVLIGESPILSRHIEDQLRGLITAFMMPIFFGLSGLYADLTILRNPQLAVLTVGLIVVASVGKFAGAFAGGKLSGLSAKEAIALGCGMNARGSTEVIIATIGLTMGALTKNLYTMIVTMAIVTTTAMPPTLRWALRRLPMRREEKRRFEKEAIDAKGFVSRMERLLIAADESSNGQFASRIAGFIAGQRGMSMTVVHVNEVKKTVAVRPSDTPLKDVATEGAKRGNRSASEDRGEDRPERVEVLARQEIKLEQAVTKEAPKGYDVLFVGVAKMCNANGSFSQDVDRAAAGFEGPLALAIAGNDAEISKGGKLNILVPVDGTETARRGAEMAFALSSPKESTISALHVSGHGSSLRRPGRRPSAKSNAEKAVLEDVAELAEHYGYDNLQIAVHVDVAAETAIIEEAERCGANVIVIGAGRRVGERLYLGHTVAHVLKKWKGSIVLVVT
jgi:Kef-type K+ transport system membrane component KefB/nucleotide-binding universal stress UspA family protein